MLDVYYIIHTMFRVRCLFSAIIAHEFAIICADSMNTCVNVVWCVYEDMMCVYATHATNHT